MSPELTPSRRIPAPDDAAHEDGLLMHELTVVNSLLGRYVLRYLDADAGRAEPATPADEHTLADRLTRSADSIRARATRQGQETAMTAQDDALSGNASPPVAEAPDHAGDPVAIDRVSDLVCVLDDAIDALTEPLFVRHSTGDGSALDIACQLGLHLLDRGCSIVTRSGLPLAGLDAAVVAAQDRAHARNEGNVPCGGRGATRPGGSWHAGTSPADDTTSS